MDELTRWSYRNGVLARRDCAVQINKKLDVIVYPNWKFDSRFGFGRPRAYRQKALSGTTCIPVFFLLRESKIYI